MAKINWLNTLFISLTTLIALVGTTVLLIFSQVAWPTWVLAGALMIIIGLSITAGYHRLCAHKSYRAAWPLRLLFALFGAAAFEGSVLEWSTDHRNHHRYTDSDKDPYNIRRGFWFAHIGWLIHLDTSQRDFSNVADLANDPIYRWQHRFFPWIAFLLGLAMPTAIAALWGDALGGFVVAGALRVMLLHQGTFLINSLCHCVGKQTYKDSTARDNWLTALVTFGEGFHNYHHQFPLDYRNGYRYFHFDPAKWLIYGLSYLKLTHNLQRIHQHKMIKYRLHFDTQRLKLLSEETIKPLYDRILQLMHRIEELRRLKANQSHCRNKRSETRRHLKLAERELKTFLTVWRRLIRHRLNNPFYALEAV